MSNSGKVFDEKEEQSLPQWQIDLINQVFNAMKDYYCLPANISGNNEQIFKNSLTETFKKVNATFEEKTAYTEKPTSKEAYKVFLDEINKTLENFDSHLHIEYNHTFIAERKSSEIVKGTNSARFDFGSGPPRDVLLEMNTFRGKPENSPFQMILDI